MKSVTSITPSSLWKVVTSTLVFEGEGRVREYIGGYDDWIRQRPPPAARSGTVKSKSGTVKPRHGDPEQRKLTYNEKRELEELPKRIDAMEEEQKRLFDRMADPAFYKNDGKDIAEAKARLMHLKLELEKAYERWEDLVDRAADS